MSVSILVVDDEPDVAEMFRQRFRREARNGTYVMHFASSGGEAIGIGGLERHQQRDRSPARFHRGRARQPADCFCG